MIDLLANHEFNSKVPLRYISYVSTIIVLRGSELPPLPLKFLLATVPFDWGNSVAVSQDDVFCFIINCYFTWIA